MIYLFRIFLFAAWIACIGTTFFAAQALGFGQLMPTFADGFANLWTAAINTDFTFHLAIASLWLIWSASSLARGFFYGVLAFTFGGSFTFAYILVQSFITKGDLRALLLGRQMAALD